MYFLSSYNLLISRTFCGLKNPCIENVFLLEQCFFYSLMKFTILMKMLNNNSVFVCSIISLGLYENKYFPIIHNGLILRNFYGMYLPIKRISLSECVLYSPLNIVVLIKEFPYNKSTFICHICPRE